MKRGSRHDPTDEDLDLTLPAADVAGDEEEGDEPADAGEAAYRRRRKPVRVRRNRWRDFLSFWRVGWKPILVASALVAAGLGVYQFLFRSSWFVLSGSAQIQIAGGHQVAPAEIDRIFGGDLGRNVFFIPLEARREALERIDWVESATVLRILPARIRVNIQERTPVAFARSGDSLRLVDGNGVILRRPATGNFDFPVLSGLAGAEAALPNQPSLVGERRAQLQLYMALRRDLDAGGRHFSADFSEINLADTGNLAARVPVPGTSDTMLVKLGDHDFAARYQVYLDHIAQWRQQVPEMSAVDFHTDGEVDVERPPQPPPAKAPPTPAKAPPKSAHGGGR